MLAKLLLLALVAASQARPRDKRDVALKHDLCPAEGHHLLPHEWDCTKFYYCEYGIRWELHRDCAPGTHFSYNLQVCVHPSLAGCTLPGVEPGTEAPQPEIESPRPITEAPQPETDTTDNEALTEDPSTSEPETEAPISVTEPETEPPTEAPATETTAPTEASTTTSAPETDAPSEITTTAAPELETQAPEGIEVLPNGCPKDFELHHLLPHESDCSKFYYCNFGEKAERDCPQPLYFNPEIQVCDWPENVECTSSNGSTEEENSESNETDSENNGSEENNNGGWLENGCPADFDVHQLLPHESDCGKFYSCDHGQKVEQSCPANLHFNHEIQVCDWPANVQCESANASNETENSSEDDNDNNETDNNVSEENNGGWLENGCPADFDIHKLLPHESNCGKFYYCVHGQKVERSCPEPLHFNPLIQVCDWPEKVQCEAGNGGDDNDNSNESEDSSNVSSEGDGDNNAESEEDNNASGESNNNSERESEESNNVSGDGDGDNNATSEEVASGEGDNNSEIESEENNNISSDSGDNNGSEEVNGGSSEEADNNVTESTSEENNGEWLENGCPADFDVHHLLPHESDCRKFYSCVHGQKVESACHEPLHFNSALQVCDWPENAQCESSNGSTSNEDNSSETDNGNSSDSASEENDNGGWLENGCPADFDVHHLLPHETECGKFYACVHGERVERACPEPLHFNPEIQVCDWPGNVQCESNGNEIASNEDSNESDNGDSTDSASDENDNGGWLENGCPADFDVHHLLPHETECGKFYACVHGDRKERDCPEYLHFNPEIQICDWPENVQCGVNGGSSNETDNSNESDNGTDGEDDNDNGSGDGSESNETENGSNEHGESNENGNESASAETDNGADSSENGSESTENNGSESAESNGNESVENNGSESAESNGSHSAENGSTETEENGSGSGEEEQEVDHSKCVESCNAKPWAHETACDKYWRCDGEKAVLVICAEGLHFNARSGTCDFICNANCVRQHVQTTADHNGLKIFVPWDKVDENMMETYDL